jgi:rod shape-determining protein MreC
MSQLFRLILQARNFLLFVLLEMACFYLIQKNNGYWGVLAFDTTNKYVAQTLAWSNSWRYYWSLFDQNDALQSENATLRKENAQYMQWVGSVNRKLYAPDSTFAQRFSFTTAKVVNSSVDLTDNYITIDKGTKDGLRVGMGVISPTGVVGQIMSCSDHFSRVYSILHSSYTLSAEVVNATLRQDLTNNALGIAKWDGQDPRLIQLTTIDRFKPIAKGDSVLTSEQNAIFPAGIPVGKIIRISSLPDEAFYKIVVALSTDFRNLRYVYVVENRLKEEQDRLEQAPVATSPSRP